MKKLLSTLLALCLMFTLVACGGGSSKNDAGKQNTVTGDEIIIGGLAPLTGSVSQYGIAVNNGVLLAIADINDNGGILGKQIKYVVEDEQGDPTEAVNAYTKLYHKDKIVALVGDVTTKPTIAVAQKAAVDGIPMITASATGAEVTQAGANVFRTCFIDPYQGQLMANYAKDNLSATTAAVLYDTGDDYSAGIAKAFKEEAEKIGLEVLNYEGYATGANDFNSQLTLIKSSNPDVVMLPCYYEDVAQIVTQARNLEIDSIMLGGDGWDGVLNQMSEANYGYLENTFYCSQYSRQSDKPEIQSFIKRYQEAYGIEENMFAILGYDSMMMMAAAIEKAGTAEYGAVTKAMSELEYEGLTGTTTFDENRNPVREAYITVFKDGESQFLETYSF